MKVIKFSDAVEGKNSDVCHTLEYSLDKDLDLGIATLTGRFPDKGYAKNKISKELVYVLDGNGKLVFKDKVVQFKKGDAILIYPEELYYYETEYCKLAMTCNPAWNPNQHEVIE